MKACTNHGKNVICLMSTLKPISIKVKDYIIKNSDNEKLSADANLILKEASKKVNVRVSENYTLL